MEISQTQNASSYLQPFGNTVIAPMGVENNDMDMDIDIDLGPIEDETTYVNSNGTYPIASQDHTSDGNAVIENATIPHKVHIYGLDDLTTGDIQAFSAEHYPSGTPTSIEWVNDTSANIVFEDPATASAALANFTNPLEAIDVLSTSLTQLREAKRLSGHPASILQVRLALSTDQKRPRAHEASRFYMLHPEHDPRERRRRVERKESNGNSDYRRMRYSDRENRRRNHKNREEGFSPSMYDDDKRSSSRGSMETSPNGKGQYASKRHREPYRRARDRSASPGQEDSGGRERRRRTPPPSYRSRDPYPFPAENTGKELFPCKSTTNEASTKNEKDLFSNKILAAGLKKELFPQKTNAISHRRSDAFDAADETADLFASGLSVSLKDGSQNYGRLKSRDIVSAADTQGNGHDGLIIRGVSEQKGFSIRGGASAAGTIKELFPGKAIGNGGKELFAEKLEGRGGRRKRAEDMFH